MSYKTQSQKNDNKLPTTHKYSNEIYESKPSSFKSGLPSYEKLKNVLLMLLNMDSG